MEKRLDIKEVASLFEDHSNKGDDINEELSVKEFDSMCDQLSELEEDYRREKSRVTEMSKGLEKFKAKLLKHLEAWGKEKYYKEGVGTLYTKNNITYSMPKDEADRQAFFHYIEEKYGFEALLRLLTVHSQTLNAFAKKEQDIAINDGNPAFKIPGLGEPKQYKQLVLRREAK